jgi:hypothetical protein
VVCWVMARREPRLLGLEHDLHISRHHWLTDSSLAIANCTSWALSEALTLPPHISSALVTSTGTLSVPCRVIPTGHTVISRAAASLTLRRARLTQSTVRVRIKVVPIAACKAVISTWSVTCMTG